MAYPPARTSTLEYPPRIPGTGGGGLAHNSDPVIITDLSGWTGDTGLTYNDFGYSIESGKVRVTAEAIRASPIAGYDETNHIHIPLATLFSGWDDTKHTMLGVRFDNFATNEANMAMGLAWTNTARTAGGGIGIGSGNRTTHYFDGGNTLAAARTGIHGAMGYISRSTVTSGTQVVHGWNLNDLAGTNNADQDLGVATTFIAIGTLGSLVIGGNCSGAIAVNDYVEVQITVWAVDNSEPA